MVSIETFPREIFSQNPKKVVCRCDLFRVLQTVVETIRQIDTDTGVCLTQSGLVDQALYLRKPSDLTAAPIEEFTRFIFSLDVNLQILKHHHLRPGLELQYFWHSTAFRHALELQLLYRVSRKLRADAFIHLYPVFRG